MVGDDGSRDVTFIECVARRLQPRIAPARGGCAGEVFATAQAPDAVRISLGGGAETREALTTSLSTVKALLNRKVGSILDF